MENKAFNQVFNDLLGKVLQLSEDPSQFADYLTQQIRELIGTRTVVIAVKPETEPVKIFSVFPVRRTEWANQNEVLKLAELTNDFEKIQYLDQETSGETIAILLKALDINKMIAIPLIAANRKVGSILLLDILDIFGIESVLDLLDRLSGVFALVIRNSHLYQNMETLVAVRTEELQSQNSTLLKREQELIVANEEYEVLNEELTDNIRKAEELNKQLITANQRAEKSELQARDILQTAMDSFWIIDLNGKFIDVNDITCKTLGYTREEMLTMSIPDIEFIEDAEQNKRRIQKIIEIGEDRFESKHHCKNGQIIDVEVSVKMQTSQNLIVTFVHDITNRKQSEEALMESEERWRRAIADSPVPIMIHDEDDQVLQLSAGWSKFSGYTINDIPTLADWTERAYGERTGFKKEYIDQLFFIDKTVNNGEWVVNAKDGAKRVWDFQTTPLGRVRGSSRVLHSMAVDITERRQTENALADEKQTLANIIEGTNAGTWNWNVLTGAVAFNERWAEIIGCTLDELQPIDINTWINHVHPDDLPMANEALQKLFNKETAYYDVEFRQPHKDGSWVWVNARGRVVEWTNEGKPINMTGTHLDISERKRAEFELIAAKEQAESGEQKLKHINEELNKRNIFIQTILDNLPVGLALNTLNEGDVTYMNSKFAEIYGWKWDEIGSISEFFEKVYPDDEYRKQLIDKVMADINSGDPEKMHWDDIKITCSDGSKKIVNTVNIPLTEQNTMVSTVIDITSLHQTKNELIVAKERAEESDRLKSAFLANMSHEIRTPMNGILGFSELLKTPGLTGDQQQEYIAIIGKSGKRMLNIINDIVDISKIEAGLMKTDIKETNVNEQIEYVYTFFKPEADAKGIHLTFRNALAAKHAILKTDREKLYSILTNLVKNAIKYTPAGSIEFGYEMVSAAVQTKHALSVQQMQFYVKDTGIGIPTDRQEAIFERFIQADITDKMARQGAGLGLSISKAFVEMLGGKIWVESRDGIGSTFYFTLPYNIEQLEKTSIENGVPSEKSDNRIHNLKILIAEDDEVSEMLISINVSEFSNEVIKAKTGTEAVEICRHNPDIDLVLMDIQMPGLNGYEATRQIRQFNTDVVIIAQTAYGLSGDREKAIAAGCNDYISKPINKEELLKLVQKYFNPLES